MLSTALSQTEYENPWLYNGKTFDSPDIGDYFGFVYLITNKYNQRQYIGRKYFWSFRKPPGKKRKVKQESDWKKYYGSCPELKGDLKVFGKLNFTREILSLHLTKGQCNYEETKQLFLNDVLIESLDTGFPRYYNSNILGRYMRKDYGSFGANGC
jgi:hypothetical protein